MAELIQRERDSYGYPVSSVKYDKLSREFYNVAKGYNPLTPYIVGYAKIENGVIEVSKGTTVDPGAYPVMYGITVIVDNKIDKEKSTCMFSMQQVYDYLKTFKP